MLFYNFISSALSALAFGALIVQAQTLADGRYRIFSGDQSARSYPIPRGDTKSTISMSNQFASVWEQWDVTSDGNGGYSIQNVGTGGKAYADQTLNAQVFASSNNQTTWFIENKSNSGVDNVWAIKVPYQDLLWTNTPRSGGDNILTLEGSDGRAEQRFYVVYL